MNLDQKLRILMALAADDQDGNGTPPPRLRHTEKVGALRPLNLRKVRRGPFQTTLLRVLMTNACSLNCHYCPMRRDRELPRTLLKPEELVRIFLESHRRGWSQGLFITTGIPGRPVKVMDDLIQVLELLRVRHRFGGYIHVKMIAGGETAQIHRLVELASRVSLNLEAPCGQTLTQIAPEKNLATSLASLDLARAEVVKEWNEEAQGKPRDRLKPGGGSGMTMQFVVGATPDPDRAILGKATELYALRGVHHAHFSAFRPISNTPMESERAVPAVREHRLYQADYLLRQYGFNQDEIVYQPDGNLPLANDPKVTWALAHPERFPVEILTAPSEELVRVPGIGPGTAKHLVDHRATSVFRDLKDLQRAGVRIAWAAGFITLGGRRLQTTRWTEQLGFWQAEDEVGTPHVVYEVSPGTFR